MPPIPPLTPMSVGPSARRLLAHGGYDVLKAAKGQTGHPHFGRTWHRPSGHRLVTDRCRTASVDVLQPRIPAPGLAFIALSDRADGLASVLPRVERLTGARHPVPIPSTGLPPLATVRDARRHHPSRPAS